jgi:hypothetical protein
VVPATGKYWNVPVSYRVVFSQDEDFLAEAARRQRSGEWFAGVIYGHQTHLTLKQSIEDLELIGRASEPEEYVNRVVFLPL